MIGRLLTRHLSCLRLAIGGDDAPSEWLRLLQGHQREEHSLISHRYGLLGASLLYDPPELARFVVGLLPGSRQKIVVAVRRALRNELRFVLGLVVDDPEIRAMLGDD